MGNFSKKTELLISNDELRPNHCRVYFKNGFLYTTDGHVLIKQNLKLFGFTEEEIKHLEGHSIDKQDWVMIRKFKEHYPVKNGIECKTKSSSFLYLFNDKDFLESKMPEMMDNIISKNESFGQQKDFTFALNMKLFNNIREAMFLNHNNALVFKVKHMNTGVILFAEGNEFTIEDQLALIMPVNINSY